jgi:hypothetical protein
MNWRGSGEAVPQQPYYNSYVMHPMLLATIEHLAPLDSRWASLCRKSWSARNDTPPCRSN